MEMEFKDWCKKVYILGFMWLTAHLYTIIHLILTGYPKYSLSFIHSTNIYESRLFANKEGEISTRT